jgi:predicted transcriptional regulator
MNYFEEIEDSAMECFDRINPGGTFPLDEQRLQPILTEEYGYAIETVDLQRYDHLRTTRSIWFCKDGTHHLLLNEGLDPVRKAFELARELGYNYLGLLKNKNVLENRGVTVPSYRVRSPAQLWADFRASYFAGALLMPQYPLERDLRVFLRRKSFDEVAVEDLAYLINGKYRVSPETFLHRLSEILPGRFGLTNLHFMRFQAEVGGGPKTPIRTNATT